MIYKYLFGPVPSRRLGISLGLDLLPHKVCTLNCVYCECGATTDLTLERKEYVPYKTVIRELDDYLAHHPEPDYITFSGAGEPTLNSKICDIVSHITRYYPQIKTAILTNASLFFDTEVRRSILEVDVVLPSIDAATRDAFLKINRPHPKLDYLEHIENLIKFRKEFKGQIWLEVFLLKDYNDSKEDLSALKNAIEKIGADSVQLNTLDRPGVLSNLEAISYSELEKIKDQWGLPNVVIISPVSERENKESFREDIENAILETISRRPCTLTDLSHILGLHENEINKYLSTLDAKDKIQALNMERGLFYQSKKN
ncbi:MAG: radical SAM protein [Candidatus Neomarinimicrobiota bacterium]|jgi:wyosine [tRNA(Phe)-imidazoG37] synthetase (radical SAM superfamily)